MWEEVWESVWGECGKVHWGVEIGEGRGMGVCGREGGGVKKSGGSMG